MGDKDNDPIALWQTMLGQMGQGFGALASQAMASPEFSKVVGQVGEASADAQKRFSEMMGSYLAGMELPSKEQMANFAERLSAIESRLDEITAALRQPAEAPMPSAGKPSRAKRPERSDGGPKQGAD